jgi:hypothetical protein
MCLMRYEDWTFRKAGVRLAEHRELRAALGWPHVTDDTTLYWFLSRFDTEVLAQVSSAVVEQLIPPQRPQATVAVGATGLTLGAVSPFFVKRAKDREQGFTRRYWLKWMMAVDVDRRVTLVQTARRGPTHDGATWRPLVSATHERVPMALGLADAEFDSERNHQHIRHVVQAYSVIPAERGAVENPRHASPYASRISGALLSTAVANCKPHLHREAQALGPSSGPPAPDAMATSVAAGYRI